jgi:hypothetical protein
MLPPEKRGEEAARAAVPHARVVLLRCARRGGAAHARTCVRCAHAAAEAKSAPTQALVIERTSPALAAALRVRHSSRLKKSDIFLLLSHWRYASDLWRARGNRPARPPAAAGAAAAASLRAHADDEDDARSGAAGVLSLPPPAPPASLACVCRTWGVLEPGSGAAPPAALWAYVGDTLRPLASAVARGLAGPAARALAAQDAAAARLFARELPTLLAAEAQAATLWLPLLARLAASVRMCELEVVDAGARRPGIGAAAEDVGALLAFGIERKRAAAALLDARAAEPGLTRAEGVWLTELRDAQGASLEMLRRMHALLAPCLRASGESSEGNAHATPAAATAMAGLLMEFMVGQSATTMACFEQRRAWVAELVARADGATHASEESASGGAARKPLLQLPPPLPPGSMPRCCRDMAPAWAAQRLEQQQQQR